MTIEFKITSSRNQHCVYKDYHYIYQGDQYVSLWELNLKTDFKYNIDNPFYIIEWTYNKKLTRLKIEGLGTDFKVDPLSKLIIIKAKHVKFERSDNLKYTINSSNDWSFCYFLENSGRVNHQLILPEFVYYKDIPWDTFLPSSKEELANSEKYPVEGLSSIVFDEDRNSLVCSYYYKYDSIQKREYDAIKKEWGAIVTAFRT
ncbi:hypothetical protein [Psychrobacter lutiphocae]|uniref:hypothetical protein n=1 Tax=Psychrobacter lutiphocae TaxID=540500 RepID=UPI00035F3729|nr:hypothetical protein [Psychrobacter lutiphocae]